MSLTFVPKTNSMPANHHVYFANASGQDVYVFVSPNSTWMIADIVTDVALLFAGIGEVKLALTAGKFPETFNTIKDVYAFLKALALISLGIGTASLRSVDAAQQVAAKLKEKMIRITPGQTVEVSDKGILSLYFGPSGIASMVADAHELTLTVLSGDNKQVAQWDTNSDYSWVATDHKVIVRSKYGGNVFDQDPQAGSVEWGA